MNGAATAFFRCVTFPLEQAGNLYGRSTWGSLWRHRFLPAIQRWILRVGFRRSALRSIIVVEGLFDAAALWQAGFSDAVDCSGIAPQPLCNSLNWSCRLPARAFLISASMPTGMAAVNERLAACSIQLHVFGKRGSRMRRVDFARRTMIPTSLLRRKRKQRRSISSAAWSRLDP